VGGSNHRKLPPNYNFAQGSSHVLSVSTTSSYPWGGERAAHSEREYPARFIQCLITFVQSDVVAAHCTLSALSMGGHNWRTAERTAAPEPQATARRGSGGGCTDRHGQPLLDCTRRSASVATLAAVFLFGSFWLSIPCQAKGKCCHLPPRRWLLCAALCSGVYP
jgi:hypothetical protein